MIWSIFHSASQVLLLAGLLSVFFTTLIVWLSLRRHMRDEWKRLKEDWSYEEQIALASGKPLGSPHTPNMIKHWPLILVAVSALPLGTFLYQLHEEYSAPTIEYTDVRFLERIEPYSWWMEKANGPFRVDFCRDFDVPALNFQPGEVAWRFKFKDMGNCWSIKDGDVRFYRDKQHWTVETDVKTDLATVLKEIKGD